MESSTNIFYIAADVGSYVWDIGFWLWGSFGALLVIGVVAGVIRMFHRKSWAGLILLCFLPCSSWAVTNYSYFAGIRCDNNVSWALRSTNINVVMVWTGGLSSVRATVLRTNDNTLYVQASCDSFAKLGIANRLWSLELEGRDGIGRYYNIESDSVSGFWILTALGTNIFNAHTTSVLVESEEDCSVSDRTRKAVLWVVGLMFCSVFWFGFRAFR